MNDLCEVGTTYTVTFRRRSKHSAERLWRAITDPADVSSWMEGPAKVELRPGGDWYVDFSVNFGEDQEALEGVIVRVDPERGLAVAWGRSVMEWTIEPADDGCTYTFAQYGVAPENMQREGVAWGWHAFLDQLDARMDGQFADRRFTSMTPEQQEAYYGGELKAIYTRHLDTVLGR